MFILFPAILKPRFLAQLSCALGLWAQLLVAHADAPATPIKLALIEALSGPTAAGGEAVFRNLAWAVERVNARGGVRLGGSGSATHPLLLLRYDNKGQNDEALSALRSAIDDGARVVLQGNSSAVAAGLIDAINKHNERTPTQRVLFLNYAAVDPALTNEKCSFWHFRFDAHADMRMRALMSVLRADQALKQVYLLGQDYSFGQSVLREARTQLSALRPDIQIVGEELHPMSRIKDFLPYIQKIKASGAQAVITGNWGNDLTLLVKAAKEGGFGGKFYTFYGNALGVPGAIGEAGVGHVVAVADWLPNFPSEADWALYRAFRSRYPSPADDYMHMRMQLMVEDLAQSLEAVGRQHPAPDAAGIDIVALATQLEHSEVSVAAQAGHMRGVDHQFQQTLMVGLMGRQGDEGVKFDVEGSGYGFKVIKTLPASAVELPSSCKMERP